MRAVKHFFLLLAVVICWGTGARPAHADLVPSAAAQELLHAIETRNTAEVTRLLHEDPSLGSLKLEKGRTPLFTAIDLYSSGSVAALLAAGADVNARDDEGVTPLIAAASEGIGIASLLIQKGADVNAKDNAGDTPLTALVSSTGQDREVLSLLLAHGANLNEPGIHGFTPLRVSVELGGSQGDDGGFAPAKTLLQKGGSYGNDFLDAVAHDDPTALDRLAKANPLLINERYAGVTPLDQAVFWQNLPAAKWLLSHGAAVNVKNDRGETPLIHLLAEAGEDEGDGGLVSVLVAHHADVNCPDKDGRTPLAVAAGIMGLDKKNAAFLLGLLLAHGAHVNAVDSGGATLLTSLTGIGPRTSGYGEAAEYLLNHGASYGSPFLDAVARGSVAAVRAMLAKKPNLVATTDGYGTPATIIAYYWGRTPLLSLLLSHGANVNARGFQGATILSSAIQGGDLHVVAFLLSKGADVNPKRKADVSAGVGDYGVAPLKLAIELSGDSTDAPLVALLLAHGADPRYVNPGDNLNAFGWAVFDDALGAVELLLRQGVDVNDSGDPRQTPLQIAIRNRRSRIALFLRQHGAER